MIRFLVNLFVFVVDIVYRNRTYPRFYVLETIARVPYFAFLSVLHLYETLGMWRKADWLKVHFAETWNELHHLLIMESLGGAAALPDRLLARSVAVVYYWVCVVLYLVSPRSAYYFMELVEAHAFHTYSVFLEEYGEELKVQPVPDVARNYYGEGDLYMFDEFQTTRRPEERRPVVENLYDVFCAIRDDEGEHVKTMVACQNPEAQKTFRSPHSVSLLETGKPG